MKIYQKAFHVKFYAQRFFEDVNQSIIRLWAREVKYCFKKLQMI